MKTSKQNINWVTDKSPVNYEIAISKMRDIVEKIYSGAENELVWLLEHPEIYTAGTSSNNSDLIGNTNIPVYQTGRGGKFTYHGPGQRIMYTMIDLRKRKKDLKMFVNKLEETVIISLKELNLNAVRLPGIIGVWIESREKKYKKISAIGIRVAKWITFHGISININPNLHNYSGIIPCGIKEHGITSLKNEGINISMEDFDTIIKKNFFRIFKYKS
ncbi:MAG: Octanoyltransferase [Alphaproteobacteria bacterium MarineAlpha2_Bin1]|nr:MAG: Octanoyltransferase [Alphaproteobacteria bacterium MarineAlpha2_Bin1]|tara:strand:+ start:487 stop:1137 length:651 start_codon:yes stop_codon:yes gene_type:complete